MGKRPPLDGVQVIHAVAAHAGLDAVPFVRGHALVRGTPLADADVEGVLAGYVRGIATLVSVLDAHHVPVSHHPPPAVGADHSTSQS